MQADRPPLGGEAHSSGVHPTSRFVATFLVIAAVGLVAYFFPYEQVGVRAERIFQVYLGGYARVTGAVLRLFDPAVSVAGTTISGRFAMQIVRSCDAMEANILFAAATLAFPAAPSRRATALLVGLPALVACNIARLCCLYYVGIHAPARFDFAHYEAWPLVMVAFATLDFLVCARWMGGGTGESRVARAGGANAVA